MVNSDNHHITLVCSEIISAMQERDTLHSAYQKSGLETNKDKLKSYKTFFQKMLHR